MTTQQARGATREKILAAAASMLSEDPTARLSVRAVAARAGVSTGSLRHFFPAQRDLIDAVVAGIASVDVLDDPLLETTGTAEERLISCLRHVLAEAGTGEAARQRWRTTYTAFIESPPGDEEARPYLALERLGIRRIEGWLETLVSEGAIPDGNIASRARFLATVLSGMVAERALPGSPTRIASEAGTLRLAALAVTCPQHGDDERPEAGGRT